MNNRNSTILRTKFSALYRSTREKNKKNAENDPKKSNEYKTSGDTTRHNRDLTTLLFNPSESAEWLKVVARKYIECLSSSSPKQHKMASQLLISNLSRVIGTRIIVGCSYLPRCFVRNIAIVHIVNISDLSDQIRKALIRQTVLTCFTRISNRQSYAAVFSVISALIRGDQTASMKYLSNSYASFFESYNTSKWAVAKSILALEWLFRLSSWLDFKNAVVVNHYMIALLSVALPICASRKFVKMERKINSMLQKISLQAVFEWMHSHYALEPSSGLNILALLSFLSCTGDNFEFGFFVDVFTSNVLLAKQHPNVAVVEASSGIFKTIDVATFRDVIMAVVKKTMLRCPEIAIFGVQHLLQSIRIDLSLFVSDLYKILSASLIVSVDEVRNLTSLSIAALATKVTDPKIFKELIEEVFRTYSGSSGKVLNATQRITVLKTLKMMSCHGIKDDIACDLIASDVLQKLNRLLISEVHHATYEAIWQAIIAWSTQIANLDEKLEPVLKGALKSSNRSAALRNMTNLCNIDNNKIFKLSNDLWKLVFDIYGSQSNAEDFIFASLLLLNEEKSKATVLQSLEKVDFCKEKFTTSLSAIGISLNMICLTKLLEKVIENVEIEKLSDMQNIFYALFMALCWPSYEVRKSASHLVKKCVADKGNRFCISFLDFLLLYLASSCAKKSVIRAHNEGSIDGKLIAAAVNTVMIPFNAVEEDFDVGITVITSGLLISCCSSMVESDPSCWNRWLRSITNVNRLFDEKGTNTMIDSVFATTDCVIRSNAIKMLMTSEKVAKSIRGQVWNYCIKLLNDIDVERYVSITDRDFAIYNTPDGVLYNTAVLELTYEQEFGCKNVKRENKAYKYKDQIFETQLKKELAEKRRLEGKLTSQQEQAKRLEMNVEQKIREELRVLYVDCKERIQPLISVISGDPFSAAKHTSLLFDFVIPLLRSPLVSSLAYEVYRSFRDAAFEPSEDYLPELILHSSVRLFHSFYINMAWSQEPLAKQVEKTIALLAARCVLPVLLDEEARNEEELIDADDEEIMSLPKFNVSFPLIDAVLRDESFPYALRLNALRLLSSVLEGSFIQLTEVQYLPLNRLCSILLHILSTDVSELHHIAKISLKTFCKLLDNCPEKDLEQATLFNTLMEVLVEENSQLRESALLGLSQLHHLYNFLISTKSGPHFVRSFKTHILIALNDPVEACVNLAEKIWQDQELFATADLVESIMNHIVSEHLFLRNSASAALGNLQKEFPQIMMPVLEKLNTLYSDYRTVQPPVYDEIGRLIQDAVDRWKSRSGIAKALNVLASSISREFVTCFIKIIVPDGISDINQECRKLMLAAAIEVIKIYGQVEMTFFLPFFEEMLDSVPNSKDFDDLRQGLVILMGTLAQHLNSSDEKVCTIVARLIESLSTPSQQVQEAVSKCLPPLVPAIKDSARELIASLSCLLVQAVSYGERRGAAYGIAGLIKGLGMSALREFELIKFFLTCLANKKNAHHREGALLAFEILCSTMGKLFEPYIVQLLPSLLVCFGDSDDKVRLAASDAARSMMSVLSSHGVKLVLPSLLSALNEESWRTKCASVELLGSMAFCAPKQLSSCLPSIVPKLMEVLSDSHSKVQKSGEKALKQIAQVIRNPEILSISSQLLMGLINPSEKTSLCLQTIVNTKFIHYIDAASLSLMIPTDMEPYLTQLLPGVQKSLLDPIPEIRTVAAKAIGAIVGCSANSTASQIRGDLVPWLKEKLVSKTSAVDRSGAAQGLVEVLKAVGQNQLPTIMPEIIKITESRETVPEVRDGYILMYIYLPMAFGDHFIPYISMIIPSILKALADENEYVRDSALKAGQRLISIYCVHARRLLLPQLQAALFDDNWRIRFAAVTLIGDFLFNISGVSGKMTSATSNEDDTMGMESAGKAIVRQLGQTCRDQIIAGIYLLRSDVSLQVRQVSSHVWKVVVANTPRTLKEMMKTLFSMLLNCLASDSDDRQVMAGRCLGDLVKKMGERIVIDVLPVLESNLSSQSVKQRLGVAISLREIIGNSTKDVILMYSAQLVEPIKKVICDPDLLVRRAAAIAFTSFYQTAGFSAFEDIVGPLLDANIISNDIVLDGLSQIMHMNGRQMLPFILPKLTHPPINIKALCELSAAAGDSLTKSIAQILDSMLNNCGTDEEINQCLKVILSVTEDKGILVILTTLLQRTQAENHIPSSTLIYLFAKNSPLDLSKFASDVLPPMLLLYNSTVDKVVENAIESLIYICRSMDQCQMLSILPTLKHSLLLLQKKVTSSCIAGFAHIKGLTPLLPIIREAILSGDAELKELASETLGITILLSSVTALQPNVVNITGPLIRVLGDRYSHTVKISILTTLYLLIDKVDMLVRPFLPQLQSTFFKALQDTSARSVRLCAGGALSRLNNIHPKSDSISLEIVNETTLITLRAILVLSKSVLSDSVIQEVLLVAEKHQKNKDLMIVQAASALRGECALKLHRLINEYVSVPEDSCRHYATIVTLQYISCANPQEVLEVYGIEKLRMAFVSAIQNEKPTISSCAIRGAASILL
ncbi:unnamed protein product, partial [Thelazia callipaeda]|uniref:TOG domain-containing protein n=1 Tax=Thelazia callipaeda TaxID=103827 RepID=A0A158RCX0_THECL